MEDSQKDFDQLKRLIKKHLKIGVDKTYDWSDGMEIKISLMWDEEEFDSSYIYMKADE